MSDVIRTACSEFVESLKAHRRQLLNALLEAADEIAAERDSIDGNSDWRSFEYPCWDERANWTLGEWEALDDEAEEYVAPANFVDGFDYITYLASDVMGWLASNGGRSAVDRLLGSLESDLPSQLIKNAEQAIDWKPELFSVLRDAVQAALDPDFQCYLSRHWTKRLRRGSG